MQALSDASMERSRRDFPKAIIFVVDVPSNWFGEKKRPAKLFSGGVIVLIASYTVCIAHGIVDPVGRTIFDKSMFFG